MTQRDEWIVLQITDTNFPAGNLGNSSGLESALAHGKVERGNPRSFFDFSILILEQNVHMMLPFLEAAYKATSLEGGLEKETLLQLDQVCNATVTNEASIRSSITQGKCFFKACKACFSRGSDDLYDYSIFVGTNNGKDEAFDRVARVLDDALDNHSEDMQGHYPVVFGAVGAGLGLSLSMTCRAFMRCVLRDLCSCATRLNIVGPLEGANMQAKVAPTVEGMISAYCDNTEGVVVENDSVYSQGALKGLFSRVPVSPSPLVDLLQSRHDALYSRLFNS